MSVIGFDDVLAATTYPPLTTVAAHCAEAGVRAVELLGEILQGGLDHSERVVISTELVIRSTTSPPRKPPRKQAGGGRQLATA